MPFYCDIKYEDRMLDAALTVPVELSRWAIPAGKMLSPKDEIATLLIGAIEKRLHIRFRCLVNHFVAKPGEDLHPGCVLLRVIADGEEIPEGYRYCFLS